MTEEATRSASIFSSDRERRLWAWTLAVLVAIYSTLGLARLLALELRYRGLLDAAFVLLAFLVGASVVTMALRIRPGGTEVGIALGIAAVYLMVFTRMAIPEERTHLIEYGVVAVFIHQALIERASRGRRVPLPAALAVLTTAVFGAIDEGIQVFLPSRVFDPVDIFVNFVAGVMAVGASVALGWASRRRVFRGY